MQPGDPAKGVAHIIDVVKSEGNAAGKPFPGHLALGPDAVSHIRQKCAEAVQFVDEWEAVSSETLY